RDFHVTGVQTCALPIFYAGSFALAYLIFRGRAAVKTTAFEIPSVRMQAAIVCVFFVLFVVKAVLRIVYGYDPEAFSYQSDPAARSEERRVGKELISQRG